MCKISLLILGSVQSEGEGGLHLTGLACLPWRPAKLGWLQCSVPNLLSLRLVWDPITAEGPWTVFGVQWGWTFFASQFICFQCRALNRNKNSVFKRSHKHNEYIYCFLKRYFVTFFSLFHSVPNVWLCISLYTLWWRMCVCLISPSFLLSLTGGYAQPLDIPVFLLSAVVLLWIKSVKWKWGLSLSLTLSLPLFPDIKTRLCLQCFSQILECCQIL